ncbi:GNAT family N-acetyltransferase [Mycobacterium sp. shizuoka-1]|uniref:GNAT family N-acetyltransferase n=1 Tax=Mycobacterium sp. shizuoka-1 TaxID=2039281 RepID=UPI000C05D6AD|nr:GNAT family N-acetyltransferase [Mycobacterium sp. shizuoka-1]GAY13965.1 N-acetyltransferase [Mycobacterium sp. shizuoka-1]
MATDKTGAPTTVTAGTDRFTIAVDGQQVGLLAFVDHDGRRIFHHTEVDDAFEGRGLASILVSEALTATRDAGLRIVAVCPMVANYLDKHHDFDDAVDPVTADAERLVAHGG